MELACLRDGITIGSISSEGSSNSIAERNYAVGVEQAKDRSDYCIAISIMVSVHYVCAVYANSKFSPKKSDESVLPILWAESFNFNTSLTRIKGQLAPASADGPTNVLGTGPVKVRWS